MQLAHDGGHLRQLPGQARANFQPTRNAERDQVGQHQLAAGPRCGQVGPDVHERFRGLGPVDQHEDPVCRSAGEQRPVRGGQVALHHPVRVDQLQQWPAHRGCGQRHDHHEGVQRLAQDVQLEPDAEDDELGQAAGVHQRGDHACIAAADPG